MLHYVPSLNKWIETSSKKSKRNGLRKWNVCKSIFLFSSGFPLFKRVHQQAKHLQIFMQVIEKNGLAVLASKMLLFRTKNRFLGHDIYQGTIKPIQRFLAFADKFPDEIKKIKNSFKDFLVVLIMCLISFLI